MRLLAKMANSAEEAWVELLPSDTLQALQERVAAQLRLHGVPMLEIMGEACPRCAWQVCALILPSDMSDGGGIEFSAPSDLQDGDVLLVTNLQPRALPDGARTGARAALARHDLDV